MILTPLGHTEFLIDIENHRGDTVRILVDSWLSDFAVGDMMERKTKIVLDPEKCKTIDAIYLSHSHTDHIDPYTLIEIYQHASPILLLPFTLRYLEPIFREYLPSVDIHFLANRETYVLSGIEITGHMWPHPDISNEDDVMMIAISSETELLFAEIDTEPDFYDEATMNALYKVFTKKNYASACYIATRNGLEGQIPYYDQKIEKRKAFRDQYIALQKEDIRASYEKYDYEEYAHFPNLYTLPGFVRGYIGQGIVYPSRMSSELAALSLFPLDEIVSIEQDYAKIASYEFSQKALLPGRQYKIQDGTIESGRKECPIGILTPMEALPDSTLISERIYAEGPLFPRDIVLDADTKQKLYELLQYRFLPYWSGSVVASLRDGILASRDAMYRICFRMASLDSDDVYLCYEFSLGQCFWREVPYSSSLAIDEDYWLADILDFLEGRQEMYSSFWHRLNPKKIYRLWMCLGANFLNHDLVFSKYQYHFSLAKNGKKPIDFLDPVFHTLSSS